MQSQLNTDISFLEFAEQIVKEKTPNTLLSYALVSLTKVMALENKSDLNNNIVRLWIASMLIEGKKVKTCKRYLSEIRSVYAKYSGIEESDIFSGIDFSGLQETSIDETAKNIDYVKRLIGKNETSDAWQDICIFFYLLYNPSVTMQDVVDLTFDNAPHFCPQTDEILNSFNSSHGRKYVFNLKQGHSRDNEITRNLAKRLQELLSSAGIRFEKGFSRSSITSLWVAFALREKINISKIRDCIGIIPLEYSALSLIEKREITESEKEQLLCKVADSINSHVQRWFVMKLRTGVTPEDVKACINDKLPGRLKTMTLYYPTRTEIHKKGRKRVAEVIPYLPNILFFKTQQNRIKSLFANIGHLAWCFKTSNLSDSDYAVISTKQMMTFQQCVGQLTSDIEMDLVEMERPIERGRKVKIVGGMMSGYEGEILDVEGEPGKRVFFLAISHDTQARWTAHVDDLYIQPLE